MKKDPKEVLEMLNIILAHIRPCRIANTTIANTTIIECNNPDSVEFVIRSAIECINQLDCKQQLNAKYGYVCNTPCTPEWKIL